MVFNTLRTWCSIFERIFEFGVAAACYPEGHLESGDLATDLQHTHFKVNQGVDFLITQLFYDNSDFFDFRERAQKAGVDIPIIPGILPILSAPQIRRFTSLCGAKLPPDLDRKLGACADDDTAARELGIEFATRQVEELWDNDVAGIHFYVLNRSYSVSKILQNLGLPGHKAPAGISKTRTIPKTGAVREPGTILKGGAIPGNSQLVSSRRLIGQGLFSVSIPMPAFRAVQR